MTGAKEEDTEVDVTTVEPIQAFLSSDEEDEDGKALMFLPVAPEIEEPEEGWPGEPVSVAFNVKIKTRSRDTVGATSPPITLFVKQSLENMTPL